MFVYKNGRGQTKDDRQAWRRARIPDGSVCEREMHDRRTNGTNANSFRQCSEYSVDSDMISHSLIDLTALIPQATSCSVTVFFQVKANQLYVTYGIGVLSLRTVNN